MDRRMIEAVAVVALLIARAAGPVAGQDAAGEDARDGGRPPMVWLKGAFGRVLGGDPSTPATAPPDERPLDAWMRQAPLELTTSVPFEDLAGVAVVARSIDGDMMEVLSDGATSFEGPDGVGHFVVTATLEQDPGVTVERAWLLDVPDRSGGPELLWEIPGVGASLVSGAGSVPGVPGHGCYAYLCVEAGYRPPAETMEPLVIAVGETPTLRLDDGSAMVHWQGRLDPLAPTDATAREAEATFVEQPMATPGLVGLEPTVAGEWLLEVRTDFDRERGWQWFLYRLSAK